MLVKGKRTLQGIDPVAWEHPADRAALSALTSLKGFDEFVKSLVGLSTERSLYLMQLSSSVRVSDKQYPAINAMLDDVLRIFDWPSRPKVFVSASPQYNARTMGVKDPFIVINSALVHLLDEDELRVVLAHEMGHIMSGHTLYKTLAYIVANVSLAVLPLANVLLLPIKIALAEWDKKSELTADRAGLLAIQDEVIASNVLMKLSGGTDLSQVNLNAFFEQAMEFESHKGALDTVHKVMNQLWISHPHPVVRLKELKAWAAGGNYQSIIEGKYTKRGEGSGNANSDYSSARKPAEDIRAGFEHYRDTLRNADDPLSRLVSGIGDGLKDIGDSLRDSFRGRDQD